MATGPALVLVLGLVLWGWLPVLLGTDAARAAGPCPSGQACLVVRLMENGTEQGSRVVTVDEIEAWHDLAAGVSYPVRSEPGGETSDERVNDGLTVRELVIRLAGEFGPFSGLSPSAVTLAEIPRPGTSALTTLEPPALEPIGENGFDAGLAPAVFVVGRADAVGFVRPLRPDPSDVNLPDYFQSFSQQPLEITLSTTARRLEVKIGANRTSVEEGEQVGLAATQITPRPAGLTYRWSFGDGTTSAEQSPVHTYTSSGTYLVRLEVRADDGSRGQSNTVTVEVEGPPSSPSPSPDPDPDPGDGDGEGDGDGGGDGGGGGGVGGGGDGDAGNPLTGPDRSEGDTGGAAPSEDAGDGGTSTPATPAPPETPTPTGPSTPAEAPGSEEPPLSAEPRIEGFLLGAGARVPTLTPAETLAAPSDAPPTTVLGTPRTAPSAAAGGSGAGGGAAGRAVTATLTAALLLLGVLRELRPSLFRRPRRNRS